MAAAAPAAKGAALAGAPAGPGAFVLFSSLSFLSSFEKVSSRSRFHSLSLSLSLSHTHTHTHTLKQVPVQGHVPGGDVLE